MRVLLYTGKGGVGKTSVAAATALRSAELGYKTIVLSTDLAHSLSDSFDMQLGNDPRQITANLWGQETELVATMEIHWKTIRRYIAAILSWRGMDEVTADEIAFFPGMEELANLLYIVHYYNDKAYDVIIVDSAPTGETLRLLTFPEVMHWWMNKMFPLGRRVVSAVSPIARTLTDIPIPDKAVMDSIQELFSEIEDIRTLLSDNKTSSVRLVANAEKMVIKEAQRTFTYLNLYGYPVDMVVCNRIIPDSVTDAYFTTWKEKQKEYRHLLDEGFSPIPIRDVPLLQQEIVGLPMLRSMAQVLYGEEDPTQVYFRGNIQNIAKEEGFYVLTIPLPFTEKKDIALTRNGDEIFIRVANYRRNIILPNILVSLPVTEARMEESSLRIKFQSALHDHQDNKSGKGGKHGR